MATAKLIRVLIIDDSESMRLSLHRFLNAFNDMEWVGESSNGLGIITEIERLRPDVVLVDIVIPHVDISELTRTIRTRFPNIQVIGTAGFEDQSIIDKVIQAGAFLCVSKNASIFLWADAVRQAAQASDTVDLVDRTGKRLPH